MSSLESFISQLLLDFQILPWQLLLKTSETNYEACRLPQSFASKNGNEVDCKKETIPNAV